MSHQRAAIMKHTRNDENKQMKLKKVGKVWGKI
jgi:hypothetical protein